MNTSCSIGCSYNDETMFDDSALTPCSSGSEILLGVQVDNHLSVNEYIDCNCH